MEQTTIPEACQEIMKLLPVWAGFLVAIYSVAIAIRIFRFILGIYIGNQE